jgi:hypothetical protein
MHGEFVLFDMRRLPAETHKGTGMIEKLYLLAVRRRPPHIIRKHLLANFRPIEISKS